MVGARLRPGDERDMQISKWEIEHEDVYHLKNLYKMIYDWMYSEGFVSAEGEDGMPEILYLDRTKQNDSQEHHAWWRLIRTPERNNYYRYFFKIDFQTINMRKIEVMHRGQKMGTNKGDVIIRVEAYLQLDYRNEWKESSLLSFINKWFVQQAYTSQISTYKRDLFLTSQRLHAAVKQYLKFRMITDMGRSFHPEKGL